MAQPLKGIPLQQPWRGWIERLISATNSAATKVTGMTAGNVFVANSAGDLDDSGVNINNVATESYVDNEITSLSILSAERYITENLLPEAELEMSSTYRIITPKTANATLTITECSGNVTITNTGASGAINLILPPGAADLEIEFEGTVAQFLRVTAAGSDKFRYHIKQTAAGGYVRSNVIGVRWKITWSGSDWSIHDLVGILLYDE